MEQTISTILFNGQFWIAFVERYKDDGTIRVGKYTFGAEPSNPDLMDFYLHKSHLMRFHQSETSIRIKKNYSINESERRTRKSFESYSIQQREWLKIRKLDRKTERKEKERERFDMKKLKKKNKKRGH